MKTHSKLTRWIYPTITTLALAGFASLCQAQSPIILSNDTSQSSAFYDGGPAGATYTWLPTGGPNGGGSIQAVIDGVATTEIDPAFNVSFNGAQYLSVSVQMMVDPNSGTTGAGGSGGYGNLQVALRDSSFSWNGMWHGAIYPPAANGWVTYTFVIPQPYISVAHV